jgi:glycosyltransferase involved in cell wall biosynthesis
MTSGFKVVPIYFNNYDYEVASEFLQQIYPNIPTPSLSDSHLFPVKGDVLIIPAYDVFVPNFQLNLTDFIGVCKVVSVVYDVLPISNPEWFPGNTHETHFIPALKKSALVSDHLIVNTNHVKNELEEVLVGFFGQEFESKVSVVPLSGSLKGFFTGENKREINFNEELWAEDITRILAVGTLEPRKGYVEILDSFLREKSKNSNLHLTIVGRAGWNTEEILNKIKECKLQFKDSFLWIPNADDAALSKLYEGADIVLCGSYNEGFGLPLAEAMDRKKVTLARDIPVFHEVSQGCAVYFGQNSDFENLSKAFENIVEVLRLGRIRIHEYKSLSPKKSAFELLSVISVL